jgi:hypothetical protein
MVRPLASFAAPDLGSAILLDVHPMFGRQFMAWPDPYRFMPRGVLTAQEDIYLSPLVQIPSDTPPASIAPFVETVVQGLFVLFQGAEFSIRTVQGIVEKLIGRRM